MSMSWSMTDALKGQRVVVFHKKECIYDGIYSNDDIPRKGMMYSPHHGVWNRIDPINKGFRLKPVEEDNLPKYLKMLLLVLKI